MLACFLLLLQALVACLEGAGEQSGFKTLLSKVRDEQSLDAQTVVSMLKLFQDTYPKIKAVLLEREQNSGEILQQTGRRAGTPLVQKQSEELDP